MEAMTTGRRQKLLSGYGYRLAVYVTWCHNSQAQATRGDRLTGSRRHTLSGDGFDRRVATRGYSLSRLTPWIKPSLIDLPFSEFSFFWPQLGIGIEADAAGIGIQYLSPLPENSGIELGPLIPVPVRLRHQHFCSFRVTGLTGCRMVRHFGI